MMRAFGITLLLAVGQAAQPPVDLCADGNQGRRERHCEMREDIVTAPALDIDPGQNGGVHVRGWSRPDVRVRTRVEGYASRAARARELVSSVRVTTAGGRLRSDGQMTLNNEHWGTSFYVDVPANTRLAINTNNGGISIEEFRGSVVMRAHNGGIRLREVGGDVRGHTQNGGLRIELSGQRWDGQGLDVETHNGGVRLTLPSNYSAELETGTVHGRVNIDFPMTMHPGRRRVYTATLGLGGPKIRAVTTNGAVLVLRR
jgi:DUF4097 and DUF4098 domain-containing protein YvlB